MKNLLLLPAMLFFSAMSIAQLYVAPNDNGTVTTSDDSDSYIYVNDEVLFVEQNVNLTENDVDPDFKASIYLRNDAQLLQGASSSNNSGTGYISVYRDNPGSDAWDYTFYGSPVGDNFSASVAGVGNINFGIKSIHTPLYDPSAPDYSSPLSLTAADQTNTTGGREGNFDTATNNLQISTRWTYTRAAGHEAGWVRIRDNNLVPPGQGFIMKGVNRDGSPSAHDFVYDFRGRPNNGTFNITVPPLNGPHPQSITPSNPSGTIYQEILSGNPYPSALDLNRVFYDTATGDLNGTDNHTNSEITQILFWDEDRSVDSHLYTDNRGGFGVWTPGASEPDGTTLGNYTVAPWLRYNSAGNPTGGQTGSGLMYDRRFAPIGQGFYFRTNNGVGAGGGDLTDMEISIKNQHRRFIKESSGQSEFRSTQPESMDQNPSSIGANGQRPDNRLSQIRLYSYFDDSHFRDMLLVFSNDATDYYDRGWDGFHQMDAVNGEAYFPVKINEATEEPEKFVIQALPYDVSKKIPYAITLTKQTKVVVQAVEKIKMHETPYMWDSQENTYQTLHGDRTASFTLPAGTYEDRFFIVFLDDTGASDISSASIQARANEPSIKAVNEVKANVNMFQNNRLGQLEIANPKGYEIEFAHIFDMSGKLVVSRTDIGENTSYNIATATMADGVYLVKLVTSDNINIDYKALVHNKK